MKSELEEFVTEKSVTYPHTKEIKHKAQQTKHKRKHCAVQRWIGTLIALVAYTYIAIIWTQTECQITPKKNRVTCLQKVSAMEDDAETDDKSPFDDFDDDLITCLYLLIVLMCVLMGESAYWCLYVVLMLEAAGVFCNM